MRKTSFIFAGIMSAIIGTAYATGENVVASKSYVDTKQVKIPAAGTNANTPGESVVTYTDTAGTIGERGIFDYDTGWDEQNEEIVEGHEGDLMTAGDVVPAIDALYSGTAGTVVVRDNRGRPIASADVYNGSTTYNAQNNADDLITAGAVQGQISGINTNINNQIINVTTNVANTLTSQNLESIKIQELTCANENDGCTLWQIGSAGQAHRLTSCDTANDCPSCGTGLSAVCGTDEFCHCVYRYCASVNDCPSCGTGAVKACTNNVCACNACKADGVVASAASECCSGHWGNANPNDHVCCGTPGSDIECSGK